jgi:hypothetical protein
VAFVLVLNLGPMGHRSGYQRSKTDIRPGRIGAWAATANERQAVANRVRYCGNGAHKSYPAPNGEWTPSLRPGKSVCWRFAPSDWPKLVDLLREAIKSGCVHVQFDGDFPTRAWAYINGKLHEARLHNAALGEYHGFPLDYQEHEPIDPNGLLRRAPREQLTIL